MTAAEQAGVKTQVGFNYLTNPMFGLARQMIEAGELGEIYAYRGVHAEDYMADPNSPISFAMTRPAGAHWPILAAMRWPQRISVRAYCTSKWTVKNTYPATPG